jgi:hypothetical protein
MRSLVSNATIAAAQRATFRRFITTTNTAIRVLTAVGRAVLRRSCSWVAPSRGKKIIKKQHLEHRCATVPHRFLRGTTQSQSTERIRGFVVAGKACQLFLAE